MADVYFLMEYPIYRHFEADDLDVLSKICEEEKRSAKEIIFKQGDPGDAMYIVRKGHVNIYIEDKNRRKLIAIVSEGEFFGEMALIEGAARSAMVMADGETELIKLSTEGFKKLKSEFSATGFKVVDVLLKFMSYRIRRTTKKAASLLKGRKKKKTIRRKK